MYHVEHEIKGVWTPVFSHEEQAACVDWARAHRPDGAAERIVSASPVIDEASRQVQKNIERRDRQPPVEALHDDGMQLVAPERADRFDLPKEPKGFLSQAESQEIADEGKVKHGPRVDEIPKTATSVPPANDKRERDTKKH